MIVLPNTPPLPLAFTSSPNINSSLLTARTSLQVDNLNNFNDSIRYVVDLENYLQLIVSVSVETIKSQDLNELVKYASLVEIVKCADVPWTNTVYEHGKRREKLNNILNNKPGTNMISWSLLDEIEMVLASISLTYIKIGSDLAGEIIEVEINPQLTEEYNEKWKQVVNFYKTSISYTMFAIQLTEMPSAKQYGSINGFIFVFLEKIADICIQMSILSKFNWINRCAESSTITNNNAMLSRVAIYVLNELKLAKNMISSVSSSNQVNLDYRLWHDYLNIIEKYSRAYAGMFLSIENYNQNKLGDAIGLIHFSLLCLQSKQGVELSGNSKNFGSKLKSKVLNKTNVHILNNLNSISTLNINKSAFKSGVILNDLTYLFDQLIILNLKYTKENNNLKFDKVIDWKDINQDSKWPLGAKIPVSKINPYTPFKESQQTDHNNNNNKYIGKGAYY
ncbi:hypothetical protein JA1_004403 [Spathaspora sp. JA1]|nr:hypothetical protein JA1_004403 [Spathaspora sp. JA1]